MSTMLSYIRSISGLPSAIITSTIVRTPAEEHPEVVGSTSSIVTSSSDNRSDVSVISQSLDSLSLEPGTGGIEASELETVSSVPIIREAEEIESSNGEDDSENEESSEEDRVTERFEGSGQITNMVPGMPDGLVDGQYRFNQVKFSNFSFFLHDRVWIKANKPHGCIDWRITEMKLDKDPKVVEIEARQKYTLTHRKVKNATPTQIFLEPLETAQGVAVETIRNTIAEVTLIPGDWLIVRTEETNTAAVGAIYSTGTFSATLCDRQEIKGKVTDIRNDRVGGAYAVIDRCYIVPPSVWGCLDLQLGSPVCAIVFQSDQTDFRFRAGTVTEDAAAVRNDERKRVDELCCDKRGITIDPSLCLDFGELKIGSEKNASFTISNSSPFMQVLRNVTVQDHQTVAKFVINIQKESEDIVAVFVPSEYKTVQVKIKCEPLLIGKTTDFCIFDFGEFQIYKELRVKVCPSQAKLIHDLTSDRVSLRTHRKLYATVHSEQERKHEPFTAPGRELVSAGIKQIRKAFFKVEVEKLKSFPIPDSIREAIKTKNSAVLFQHFPTLTATIEELKYAKVRKLTPENYKEMFHVALWMEELFHLTRRQNDNLENVIFSKSGESYFFEFPKLQDVYPKFQPNDPLHFVDPANPGKVYHANIARLGASHVFIDLKDDVFKDYDGRPLSVEFLLGRNAYKRCHHAVEKIMQNWGTEWLFPTQFTCLDPKIMFIEDSADGNHNNEVEEETVSLLYRKKLPQKRTKKFGIAIPRGGKRSGNVYPIQPKQMNPLLGGNPESPAAVDMQLKWANKCLNEEQKAAIRMILRGQARPLPYIIFGPPGTGKTVTVVEAVIQIYKLDPNSRILVCGPSNASANQISTYLMEVGKFEPGEFVRFVGFNTTEGLIPELLKNYCMDGNQIQSVYMSRIIITTCNSAAQFVETFGIMEDRFTHVLIDEAGYCHEPDSLIPCILLSKNNEPPQVILAGDPNQLGPVLFDDYSSFYGLKTSFLERLMDNPLYKRDEESFKYPPLLITKLIRNYRAHRDLLALPSKLFYDNELIPASEENLGELANRLPFLPKPGVPLLFHGVRGEQSRDSDSPSWYNPVEVVQVVHYVNLLLNNNCIPDDIGIISPYRKQVEKIKDALRKEVKCRPIRVGSVEEFQGGEKKIIILSLVRSMDMDEENESLMRLSFAFSAKRFNVCLTRAKSLLIGIGNPHVFALEYVWRQFLKYSIQKGAYIGCDLPPILQIFARKCARTGNLDSSGAGITEGGDEAGNEDESLKGPYFDMDESCDDDDDDF